MRHRCCSSCPLTQLRLRSPSAAACRAPAARRGARGAAPTLARAPLSSVGGGSDNGEVVAARAAAAAAVPPPTRSAGEAPAPGGTPRAATYERVRKARTRRARARSPPTEAAAAAAASPRTTDGGGGCGGGGAPRRLHINPLSDEYLGQPPQPPDWPSLVADVTRPLHLDLGCAYGEFCIGMAGQRPEVNWAGTELRERVIARAREAAEGGGGNVAFVFANARHPDFAEALLHGYGGPLVGVTCLFPDPWAQPRYRRRRLLQPELVAALAARLAAGGAFVVASDNLPLAQEMRAHLAACAALEPAAGVAGTADEADGFAAHSPFPVATNWECTCLGRGAPTYWASYVKRQAQVIGAGDADGIAC